MRKPYIAGNWKMNLTVPQAVELAKGLVAAIKTTDCKVAIAPNFTCLDAVSKVVRGTPIRLACQNCATEEKGAYTGETSVDMLQAVGVQTIILGHSERRTYYGETDAVINQKVRLALSKGFEVILCVGETLAQREAGQAEAVVNAQLEGGLAGVSFDEMARVVIAYEPVWAIGTGKTATPQDAQAVHRAARTKIASLYNSAIAESTVIQYGGSMKADNVKELLAMDDIDGGLIGGASLKVETFEPIVHFNH